jgi:aerobic-type carbon monoxide dehydrogenase small subunit (CoxS/CutS family)
MAERDVRSGVSAEVVTTGGLGTIRNRHLIQEAYVLSGTIQCRFRAPPMIVATIFPQQTVESK